MSSILKALKKVEGDQTAPRNTESWSGEFNTKSAIRKKARRSQGLRRVGTLVVVAVLLIGGGWILYSRGDVIRRMAVALTKSPPDSDITVEEERKPESPASTAPEQAPPPRPEKPSAAKPVPLPVKAASMVEHAEPTAPPPAPRPEPADSKAGIPEERSPSSERTVETRSSGTLDTGAYRLEAIVWSNNPSSRFAVINGVIVKVGGSTEGVTVTEIERNSVTIQAGRETGKLRFNLE